MNAPGDLVIESAGSAPGDLPLHPPSRRVQQESTGKYEVNQNRWWWGPAPPAVGTYQIAHCRSARPRRHQPGAITKPRRLTARPSCESHLPVPVGPENLIAPRRATDRLHPVLRAPPEYPKKRGGHKDPDVAESRCSSRTLVVRLNDERTASRTSTASAARTDDPRDFPPRRRRRRPGGHGVGPCRRREVPAPFGPWEWAGMGRRAPRRTGEPQPERS